MRPRHSLPLPKIWLMTDERMGELLFDALGRLPRGAGVVFRHYGLPMRQRRALFARVRTITRARRLLLVLAGSAQLASAWRADGVHGHVPRGRTARRLLRTVPVHSARERVAAERRGANLLFVSPVFATRSHPGAHCLGRSGLGRIASHATRPIIALGGMNDRRARSLGANGIYGWAAIDAWLAG
jgi:thiamine-phosphate pyrophosphorylase